MSLCLIPAGIEGYAFVDCILADVKCFCAVSVAVPTGEHIALFDGVVFNIDKLTVHNLLILYLRAAVRVESYRKTRMAYCKNYTGNKNNNTHEYKPIGGSYRYFDISVKPSRGYEYGRDEVIKSCELNASASKMQQLTDADRAVVTENLNENVISIVKAHPETTFYFFYPPYSIAHWGMEINNGQLDRTLGAENLITKELLRYDNVRLYSFRCNSELICNLDNYKDAKHYGEWVNSQMLQWMKNDEYRITEENLAEYEKNADDLIKSYDYDQLFK